MVYWNERADWLTPGAVCGLACRMLDSHGQPVGAVVVKSDRYDLSPKRQGCFVQRLAQHASQLLKDTLATSTRLSQAQTNG